MCFLFRNVGLIIWDAIFCYCTYVSMTAGRQQKYIHRSNKRYYMYLVSHFSHCRLSSEQVHGVLSYVGPPSFIYIYILNVS
jgi:hypothetical protein